MKTYKERLPEIDKAIFKLGGEWIARKRDSENLIVSTENNSRWGYGTYQGYTSPCDAEDTWIFVCTRAEFEARVADWLRLYEARRRKADIVIHFEEWLRWSKDGGMQGALESKRIAEEQGLNWQLSLEEKPKSGWFERGDKCEVLIYGVDEWLPAKFVGLDPDSSDPIFKHVKGYSRVEDSRPIQTEKNRLVEEYTDKIMRDGNCNGDEMFTVEEAVALMYDNNWRPVSGVQS